MKTKICLICKNKFIINKFSPSQKYCSLKCFGISISKIIKVNCSNCGNLIIRRPHRIKRNKDNFCSRKCYHEFASKHHIDKNGHNFKEGKSLQKYFCKDCGKKIVYYNKMSGFCKSCFQLGERNKNWIKNLIREYPLEFNKHLKQEILIRDNYTCQLCNFTNKQHFKKYGRKIEIHHIDYNKKNCREDNLITLCKICNIKVNKNRKNWLKILRGKN